MDCIIRSPLHTGVKNAARRNGRGEKKTLSQARSRAILAVEITVPMFSLNCDKQIRFCKSSQQKDGRYTLKRQFSKTIRSELCRERFVLGKHETNVFGSL